MSGLADIRRRHADRERAVEVGAVIVNHPDWQGWVRTEMHADVAALLARLERLERVAAAARTVADYCDERAAAWDLAGEDFEEAAKRLREALDAATACPECEVKR